ncbi:superinfection immunity protein [Streptococcus suis]|uniref:superinfection immunity protein n=1 Tax=Streptococcus suis TaxID=1307 RepID=UPI000CF4DBA8|nr:superinfection immunity protein [Streptococcus suis]
MDRNQVYIDRLRKVLWENQEDLKKVTSYDFCTSCQDYVLTSNYCQQCGQMNLSTETVSFGESQSLLDNSQYYMVQSNRWLDRWGLWLEEQLNKVGIEINQGTLFHLGSLHKFLVILFTIVSVLSFFLTIFPVLTYPFFLPNVVSLVFTALLVFLNYQLYKGQSHKVLLGGAGLLGTSLVALLLGILTSDSLVLPMLMFSMLFMGALLIVPLLLKPSAAQGIEKASSMAKEKVSVPHFKVASAKEQKETVAAAHVPVQHPNPRPNYNRSEDAFKYRHTGSTILNWLFFGVPLIVLLLSASSLSEFLSNYGIYIGDSIFALILAATFFTFIYFLPAFICQSSGLKIVIWLLNIPLGGTVIGWFILLFVATSSNKNRRRQQEMDYLIRKMADR